MKRNFKKAALAFGIIAIALIGCRKEQIILNPTLNDASESEIQSLSVQTETESDAFEIMYDETTNEMVAVNEGIAADYLVSDKDFSVEETPSGSSSTSNVRDHSFLRCLKDLKLEDDQIKKIRIALGEYKDCKASAIHRARAIHAKLVAKYKDLAAEQAKLLTDGKITKAEYEQRIARLRHAFQKELRELQLKEKLHEALKDCHAKFLRQLNGVLTDRQWKAFVNCYRK